MVKARTAENEETPARVRVRSRALDLYFLKLRGVVFSACGCIMFGLRLIPGMLFLESALSKGTTGSWNSVL